MQNINLKKSYLYMSITTFSILGPLRTVYLMGKGLTFAEIMYMHSAYNLIKAVLEIPSGLISDIKGKKMPLIIGTLFKLSFYIALIIFHNFYFLLLFFIIQGIGDTLKTNTEISYLHDISKTENEFNYMHGKIKGTAVLITILINIAGGYLYKFNPDYPFVISSIILLIGLIICLTLEKYEPRIKETQMKSTKTKIKWLLKDELTIIKSNTNTKNLIHLGIISSISIEILKSLKQPYWNYIGMTDTEIGIIGAFLQIPAIFAGLFSIKIIKITKENTMNIILICYSLILSFLYFINIKIGFLIYLTTPFLNVLGIIYINKCLNNEINNKSRTTVLATYSFITGIISSLTLLISGKVTNNYGYKRTIILTSSILTILLLIKKIKSVMNNKLFINNKLS